MTLITTDYADQQLMTGATGSTTTTFTAPWNGAKIILATNNFQPTKGRALADLTQPTYTGYAAQAITWTGPNRDGANQSAAFGGLALFKMTNNTNPTTCYGYGITDSGGTHLLGSELFASGPLSLTDTFSQIGIVPELPLILVNNASATIIT